MEKLLQWVMGAMNVLEQVLKNVRCTVGQPEAAARGPDRAGWMLEYRPGKQKEGPDQVLCARFQTRHQEVQACLMARHPLTTFVISGKLRTGIPMSMPKALGYEKAMWSVSKVRGMWE